VAACPAASSALLVLVVGGRDPGRGATASVVRGDSGESPARVSLEETMTSKPSTRRLYLRLCFIYLVWNLLTTWWVRTENKGVT
jgi:hypothetical protein